MDRFSQLFVAASLSFCTFVGSAAFAATTIYNDRATWQAAAGPATTIDFSVDDNGQPLTNPPSFTFASSWTLKGVTFLSAYSYYNSALFAFATSPIHVDLPANIAAFGVDLRPFENVSGTYTIKLSTGETFQPAAGTIPATVDFFGVTSSTPLSWVEISLDSNGLLMDNFSFAAQAAALQVRIDIKPGTDNDINPVNPGSNGVIPVSIISTSTFDARTVSPASVRFGRNGTEAAASTYSIKDSNGDGIPDMVLQFPTQSTGIKCGDTSAKLSGQTTSGLKINGADYIKTVGCN